jgi:hypothetical protein
MYDDICLTKIVILLSIIQTVSIVIIMFVLRKTTEIRRK